ncbi:hypothetical protein H1R20_g5428, partial [Candolleomyces eurysporus]
MKKRALTADELLRLQEGPASKRLKIRDGKALHIRHSSSEPGSDDSQDEAGRTSDYSEEEDDSDVDFRIPHKAYRAAKGTWTDEDGSEEEEEDEGSSDDESSTNTSHFNIGSEPLIQDRFASALKKKERDVSLPNSTPVAHTWTSLGVSTPLQTAMKSMSITTPTEVQEETVSGTLKPAPEKRLLSPFQFYKNFWSTLTEYLHWFLHLPEKKGSKKPTKPSKKGKKKSTEEEEIVQPPPTIIFCSRAQSAAYLTLLLKALGIRSTALHSRLTQRERLSSLSLFRASVVPVLVSTDVGARGLDIEDVAMVVNWDLPVEPEEYTHRVGRTARAGKGGVAISFVTEHDEDRVVRIEGRINTKLEEMSLPEERVLEKLNAVSTAKRVARMDTDWDSVLQFVQEPLDLDFVPKQPPSSPPVAHAPQQSHDGSPVIDDSEESTVVSISTTFYPGAHLSPLQPDVILLSADGVFFYVHSSTLLAASDNGFGGRLPHPTPLDPASKDLDPFFSVPDQSSVLNVILHSAYDKSCAHYSPQFPTLAAAVNRLPTYGIPPKSRIQPSTPLYNVLLSYAPLFPLELYTLAATHDLYDLAVATSSHLLSFPLFQITDEMAERIGPVYLKKLFFLHFGRSDALKRVLLPPPQPHPPTPWCDFTEQKKLTRAWALASAYLAWDARPDLSTSTMESALRPLAEHLTCEQCQGTLRDRIKNLVVQWSVIKRTI